MQNMLIALIAWCLCGVVGFLSWWSKDLPVDAYALDDALASGVLGPITIVSGALLSGWLLHRFMRVAEENARKPIRIRSNRDRHQRR